LFVESFGWYASGNYIYITMEYLPHGDLEKYLSQPLREDETQQIASQVVRGLQWMHMLKFIHRDLKPAVGYLMALSFLSGPSDATNVDEEPSRCRQTTEELVGQDQ
jgi:serine/threonine protein kinase